MTKKVLFINQEMTPHVPEIETSLMGRNLPQAMQENSCEIRTFMPGWGNINKRRGQLHEVIRLLGMNLIIGDTDRPLLIRAASIPRVRIQVYFIDNEDYFIKRQMAVDKSGVKYSDSGERATFFVRSVPETVRKLRWVPDIIHCQGWMGAVIPLYVKTAYKDEPSFANAKIISSLFQTQSETDLGANFKRCVRFKDAKLDLLKPYSEKFDFFELGRLAIDYSGDIIEADADVSERLSKYCTNKELPFLEYPGSGLTKAYQKFYDPVLRK